MPRLLSLYGRAVLALHEATRTGVRDTYAPNLYRVVLSESNEIATMELRYDDLLSEIDDVVTAHEWRLQSRPLVTFDVDPSLDDLRVDAKHVTHFGLLEVRDDGGERIVPLKNPRAILGRAHDAPPRDFVPIADASRSLSREHLLFECRDGRWSVTLVGRNTTNCDDQQLEPSVARPLDPGARIVCSPHTVIFREALPSDQ